MSTPRPWPAIDVAELRYGLAFGSSVEEIADFLLAGLRGFAQEMVE